MCAGCSVWTSRAMESAPRPGAGTDRPALSLKIWLASSSSIKRYDTYVEVEVNAMTPRRGHPSSRAVFALMST